MEDYREYKATITVYVEATSVSDAEDEVREQLQLEDDVRVIVEEE